ncbi:MAG: helix-turn-helix domain-containing protein [Gammaproteobacteria bacterium]
MKSQVNIADLEFRSHCPVARSLDLIGDKWTLLIMRDALVLDCRTFADFAGSLESIPTNLLSSRLKKLVKLGLLQKRQYHERPVRFEYLPTPLGQEVRPLLTAMKVFGETHLQGKG